MASFRQELESLRKILQALGSRARPEVGPLLNLVNAAIAGRQVTIPSSLRNLLKQVRASAGGSGSRSAGSSGRQPEDQFRSWKPPEPGEPRDRPPGNVTRAPLYPPNQQRTRMPQGYPEEQPQFTDEFLTPSSSNVYSFQFYRRPGDQVGFLFVTFKASAINRKAISYGDPRHKGGRRQLRGIAGKTVGPGRSNAPGPTYVYTGVSGAGEQGVPVSVFNDMKTAYSKGKFVWEVLRGHTKGTPVDYNAGYRYSLVVGQLLKGSKLPYIPRKATNRGFVTRSVSDIGTGRRSFISSTLPPSSRNGGGFSTRKLF